MREGREVRPVRCAKCRSAYWDVEKRGAGEGEQEVVEAMEEEVVVQLEAGGTLTFQEEVREGVKRLMMEQPEMDEGVARRQVEGVVKKRRWEAANGCMGEESVASNSAAGISNGDGGNNAVESSRAGMVEELRKRFNLKKGSEI